LLLADDRDEFARQAGMDLLVQFQEDGPDVPASGLIAGNVAGGKVWVDWPGHTGEVVVQAGGKPMITIYRRGLGAIWLVHRPEFLTNELLKKADNGALLCRLAADMLQQTPGRIAFDEYFHGMRDRPGITELLLEPPALWGTCQVFLLMAVVLWRSMPRFGAIVPERRASRRSKEEFLGAMAALLERRRDYPAAFVSARAALTRDLEQALGLPAGSPAAQIVQEAARRRPIDQQLFQRLLTLSPESAAAFVKSMNELETAREQFFSQR
jgi:hypothetical protein